MLRRTAFLALSSLALSGCVTYEVVERRVYHEDGSYTRTYDPYDDGRRYEERRYEDDRYGRDGRVRRYAYDAPRYGGYGYDDDPYDRWFYGYRGYGSDWALDPYFGYRGSSVRIIYGHRSYRPTWYWSSWYSPSWSNRWSWSPSWYSGYRPWGGGYYGHGYGYGYGHGYTPSRPHVPRPQEPRPVEPRPMPKPVVRGVGPQVPMPVMSGPSIGGEALRPVAREQRWEEPGPQATMPEASPRAKPQPVFADASSPEPSMPRFEPREPERVFERRVEAPRFEPREEPRFEPREEPRFEPREEPRFEPRDEPRFEPREEPRFEPREEPRFEPREEPQPVEERLE